MEEGSLDEEVLEKFLENNPGFVERWLTEKADPDFVSSLMEKHKLHNNGVGETSSIQDFPIMSRSKRNSVTSELFQSWLSSSPKHKVSRAASTIATRIHLLDENEMFMEMIKDISNELDIDTLCHKILVNVGYLTNADRGSLFLARGPRDNRYLVAKLFDVTVDSDAEESIQKAKSEELTIPFGVGIAGHVAEKKEVVNIKDAYKDHRFNKDVDKKTGYKTYSVLATPICNYEGEVIGVAQIINKKNGTQEFTHHDIEVFQRYLTFCGIGIQNAQLFEMSVAEYRRNQLLLNLARSIFEEQTSLERLVTKIMAEAKDLLKCEHCAVYLLDVHMYEASELEKMIFLKPSKKVVEQPKALCRRESKTVSIEDIFKQQGTQFRMVFEMRPQDAMGEVHRPTVAEVEESPLTKVAKYVAASSEILNIGDVAAWMRERLPPLIVVQNTNSDPDDDVKPLVEMVMAQKAAARSLLSLPIYNGQRQIIGVTQLLNKANGQPFTDSDVSTFEAFAIFCGLGIHNTQLYESACKLMAKQRVALECLSYHATASSDDTDRLNQEDIPSCHSYNLYSYQFNDFELTDIDTCKGTIRMFLELDLLSTFCIPYEVLCRWVLSVKKNYRPVKYHNWRHAFNVAQTMFAVLKTGKMERFMDDRDILGLLVACLSHDLDHRGTNNAFQTKTDSPLAVLYSTSTMEHHHFDQCVMILSSEGNNIFQALSPEEYRRVMKIVEKAILSTDLAMYFKKKSKFIDLVEDGEIAWQGGEKKELLCGMMMTACDVSAISKPWEIQHKVAKLVADEFFDQGDLEKLQLNQQPVAMMDRERKDELPQMQVGFIDLICLPLYKTLSETFPWISPLYEGTMNNRQHWQDLAEKVEMGLTWIDHDTIEKPVEEFTTRSEPKDIEFTVTTLNCVHELERQKELAMKHQSRPVWHMCNVLGRHNLKKSGTGRVKLQNALNSGKGRSRSNSSTASVSSQSKPSGLPKPKSKLCTVS